MVQVSATTKISGRICGSVIARNRAPPAGAVELGRLVELRVDALQRRP